MPKHAKPGDAALALCLALCSCASSPPAPCASPASPTCGRGRLDPAVVRRVVRAVPTVLAKGESSPYAIAVDSDVIYWTDRGDNTIRKLAK
jgi:hypothetical protein